MNRPWTLYEKIALSLGATPGTIRKWREKTRQVPPEWRIDIIREANRRGLALSFDEFAPPARGKRKAKARRG